MLKEKAKRYFLMENCNCAEALLRAADEEYEMKLTDETLRSVGGFGGGFGCGMTCGALCGAMAALSVKLVEGKAHETPDFRQISGDFARLFCREAGGSQCDSLKPVYFQEEGRCVGLVEKTADLLEGYMESLG